MKTLFRTALIAAAVALPAAASAAPAHHAHAPKAAPAKAKAAAAKPARAQGIWIDVRTPEEYAAGHLENAKNIPHDQIGQQIAAHVPNKNTPINLYCRSGRRAETAKQVLESMGSTNVQIRGGYEQLKQSGMR